MPSVTDRYGFSRVSRTGLPPSLASGPVSREAGAGRRPSVARASGSNQGLAVARKLERFRVTIDLSQPSLALRHFNEDTEFRRVFWREIENAYFAPDFAHHPLHVLPELSTPTRRGHRVLHALT